ncbi:MAG: hypothetical protein AB7E31_16410 [Desulfitobacterium sp.]
MNSDSYHANEEDRLWLLENPLPESPGLFSKSQLWYKYSSYEIKEINERLYISPCPGATRESYKPFEKFPQILSDFMSLLISMAKLPKKFDHITSTSHLQKLFKKRESDCAEQLLQFVNKYGLFGLMDEFKESIEPIRMENRLDDYENMIVLLNKSAFSDYPSGGKILQSYTDEGIFSFSPIMKYDDFFSYFLPSLQAPYPNLNTNQFLESYSERVNDIYINKNIRYLTWHIEKMNEYYAKNADPTDKVPNMSFEWRHWLAYPIDNIGFTFGYDIETNKWDLSWNFKSLVGALSIMYFMNLTGKLGSDVHVCKYSKCDKIVIDRNCCCEKHDNAYRKAKERARKAKQKEAQQE